MYKTYFPQKFARLLNPTNSLQLFREKIRIVKYKKIVVKSEMLNICTFIRLTYVRGYYF